MLNLQLGMRYSIGRSMRPGMRASLGAVPLPPGDPEKLVPEDFTEKVNVTFPSCGSAVTPAHPSHDFGWKDFCPRVFR